jgi:hypothetical protein
MNAARASESLLAPRIGAWPRLLSDWLRTERVVAVATGLTFTWLVLLGLVLPFDPDEAVYGVIARGIIEGDWPYRDLFDHKQPLLYLYYLPVGLGASIELERVIAAGFVAVSIPAFSVAAQRFFDGRKRDWAVIAYALFVASPLIGVRANAEAFLMLPMVASVAAPSPLLAGALLGVAGGTKLVGLSVAPVVFLLWRGSWWKVAVGAGVVALLIALPFVPVMSDFWDANVTFNSDYRDVSFGRFSGPELVRYLLLPSTLVIVAVLPLFVAALAGLAVERRAPVLVWALCAYAATKATGFWFEHYYILLAPPAALLAAHTLHRATERRRILLGLAALSLPALAVSLAALYYVTAADDGDRSDVTSVIRDHPGELYILGAASEYYAHAGRHPQRRWFFSAALLTRDEWSDEIRRSIEACPPEVILVADIGTAWEIDWWRDIAPLYRLRQTYDGLKMVVLAGPQRRC